MSLKLLSLLLCVVSGLAQAESRIDCTLVYGGETRVLSALPTVSPYVVEAIPVGSYFYFKLVFQTRPVDLAGVHIYTYALRDGAPVLVHQASHPWPLAAHGERRYGFTGLHKIYEPTLEGELAYSCRQVAVGRRAVRS